MQTRLAPAKINLTLHVTGQRADGYHLLDSLVVFAEAGDVVGYAPAPEATLSITGMGARALSAEADNLILRAARLMGRGGAFTLDKRLPVASGMGGGTSDAAAAVHLMAAGAPLPGTEALMRLGADMPVCMAAPQPARMTGLGEGVERLSGVPALWMVLVNPGVHQSTPAVFKALTRRDNAPMPARLPGWPDAGALIRWLGAMRNDLQAPAIALSPVIDTVLAALGAQPGCGLARMTGSGATCFGLFHTEAAARTAAAALARPGWWVVATRSVGS